MFERVIDIIKANQIDEVYYTGCFDGEENDFIVNANYVYFEMGSKYICCEAVESYSKLKIYTTSSIIYNNHVEDWVDGKIKVSEMVFINPLSNQRKIKKASFINLQKEKSTFFVIFCVSNLMMRILFLLIQAFWELRLEDVGKKNFGRIIIFKGNH